MGGGGQFLLLMKKNWLLQKRKKVVTVLEIGLPALFALILLIIRQEVTQTFYTSPTNWSSFPVDEFREDFYPPMFENASSMLPPMLENASIPWKLCYTPNTTLTREIMTRASIRLRFRIYSFGAGFATEEDMLAYLGQQNAETLGTMGGVTFSFPDPDTLPNNVNYTIRLKPEQFYGRGARVRFTSSSDWYTSFTFPSTPPGFGPRQRNQTDGGLPGYAREGFLTVMRAIDMAILNIKNGSSQATDDVEAMEVRLRRHPFPPFVEDPLILVLQSDFTFIILISFIVTAPNICKDIVLEKERKLREIMKMMGLKLWMNWLSWFVKYLLFLLLSVSIMTFFYHLNLGQGAVITYTHWSITWMFIFLYAVTVVMFCFMVSTFFSKASSAAAAGGILFLVLYLPYYFYQFRYYSLSLAQKLLPCLSFQMTMALGCVQFAIYESKGIGLQWHNLFKPVSVDDNFSMGIVWCMYLVDCLIYGAIAWYFDHLFPGEYGLREKWYFPFTKQFWCGSPPNGSAIHAWEDDLNDVDRGEKAEFFEASPQNSKIGVKIRNLTRTFERNGEKKNAVDKLSLDMAEGEITALLGHNGAGKTTTMFMLTGFLAPSSGTAYVNGHDIRSDMKGVRESLGLCPQHDVLFDTLTVEEHLEFFAQLKGTPKKEVKEEVRKMIEVLHLEDKTKKQAQSLSGGMKRKLCVGIALIGGSKVVILDEPTSGMDPEARRKTWDILKSQREGRTMILSTHFMDEADYLGDRIAIMAEGVAQCEGSSLFLKGKYGVGYHMVIVKSPSCNVGKLTAVVKSYVPDAALESNISAELSYVLPSESSDKFEELFEDMEKNKDAYGISSYGASVTTMEEVFLKVGDTTDGSTRSRLLHVDTDPSFTNPAFESDDPAARNSTIDNGTNGVNNGTNGLHKAPSANSLADRRVENGNQAPTVFGTTFERNTGFALGRQQFRAMFEKRVIHSMRNKLVTIVQLAVPLFFVIIAAAIIKTLPGSREPPALELTMSSYRNPVAPYATDNKTLNRILGEEYSRYLTPLVETQNLNAMTGEEYPEVDVYLADFATENFEAYVDSWMTAADIGENETSGADIFLGYFNNEAYHSPGITTNVIDNVLTQYVLGTDHNITVINHPLPRSDSNRIEEEWNTSLVLSFIISYNVSFGMAFLAGTFIVFLIKEREVKSKHCQFVSGVHVTNFWASTFLWDIINFMIPCVLLVIVYIAFGIDPYWKDLNALYTLLTFFIFGMAILPCVYLFSFVFTVPSSGYVWITVLNILIGTIAIFVVAILKIPDLGLVPVGDALDWVCFAILPNYAFYTTMQYIYYNYETIRVCDQLYTLGDDQGLNLCSFLQENNLTNPCCLDNCGDYCALYQTNYFAWDYPGMGKGFTFMGLQCVVFWLWIFIAESSTAKQMKQRAVAGTNRPEQHKYNDDAVSLEPAMPHVEEDSDVMAERTRIMTTPLSEQTDSLILKELKKFYGSFLAVDRLAVGIPDGECFGLLGVNGAGKTTTFKMLTGDETITAGEAYMDGYSVNSEIKKVRQKLGYCPQFDALIEQMTVTETLRMYGRLRGIDEKSLPNVVTTLIKNLLLTEHAEKQAGTLSGGNKRKLSTAIALIGDPPLVFLDEPTTGMDPVARRMLWDTLTKVRASGRTLVLTSHSMEECEALCTRLAIMVNGQFKCLGSPQHLKTKFGKGYTLMVKVRGGPDEEVTQRTQALMRFIEDTFPDSILKDIHQGLVHYQITAGNVSWASVFGTMERAKVEYAIEDYSVSQTTLEQVFINFARAQREPREDSIKCTTKCSNCFRFFCLCGCCKDDSNEPETYTSHL